MDNATTTNLLKSLEALYLEGKLPEAVSQLKTYEAQLEPAFFHYNLGTLYARMEDFGAGRYHLEKALQLGGPQTEVLNNLSFIKAQLGYQEMASSSHIYDRVLALLLEVPGPLFLSTTLVLILLGLIFIKWRGVKSIFALGFYFLLALTPIGLDTLWLRQHQMAVITTGAQVQEGPSALFTQKFEISPGMKVLVTPEPVDGWYFIKRPIYLSGWIKKEHLGLL